MKSELFILKYKWLIIGLTALLVIVSIIPLKNITINPDLLSYLPESMPSKINNDKIEQAFGKSDPLIIVFKTVDILNKASLERLKSISAEFNQMPDFDNVMSLFDAKNIVGNQGSMIVEKVIKKIPESQTEKELLRKEIKANDLIYKTIVSEDFKYTLILLNSISNKTDSELMAAINEVLNKYPGNEEVYINGQVFMRAEASDKITRDLGILLPIGLLVMAFFLWVSFKEKRGVFLPTLVVTISILVSMALIPLFGWQLSIIGILIPIMMIAIANDYGIHFIIKYQELNAKHPELSMKQISEKAITYLKKPVLVTGITTIVGIGGLITHIMLPAKQVGVVSVIGIAVAVVLSLTFIPALSSVLKKGKIHNGFKKNGNNPLNKILALLANRITKYPRIVIYIFACFLVLSGIGISRFKIASDFNNILPGKHSFNKALNIANEHFGGTKTISIVFEGDMKNPEILKRMDFYESELEKNPEIGSITSIASLIKIMSKAINDPGDKFYNKIPNSRQAVAQYLELYAMSGDPEDLEDFVDFDYSKGILQIQYQAIDIETMNRITGKIETITSNDKNIEVIGGMSLIEKELSEAIATGQKHSLLFAFFAILIILMIIFRSKVAGFIGSIPLLFALICIFGLMGWMGIELNIVTAMLSSISIGLGVDYTIHIFWRIKSELKIGKSYSEAITTSLMTTGRGITINALSVIVGFAILLFSAFPIIQSFAFLIIISIFFCLISALILVPAICILGKPKFLKTKN